MTTQARAEADEAARRGASAAGVVIRDLTELCELEQVLQLYGRIWGRIENPPVPLELLRALTMSGSYVSGAFAADGHLIGAGVGFFHDPSHHTMHSHIAGVDPSMSGRQVGFALKLHQRSWALQRGISRIAWTFDPLVSRNAYFNLVKLGVRPVTYLPNHYGAQIDQINGVDDSDRLLVHWDLLDATVQQVCAATSRTSPIEELQEAVSAISMGADGSPVLGRLDGAVSVVTVPRDISSLRATDPAMAHRWRGAVRDVLVALLADGGLISGFDRSGRYVIRREP